MITSERTRSVSAGPQKIAARRLIATGLFCANMVSLTGCYAFIPTTSNTLAEATPVTVKLTEDGTVALRETLGRGVEEIEGTVLRASADSIVITVAKMYTTGRQEFASSGNVAALARKHVETVAVRTFSRKRSILMIAGAVLLGAAGAASVGLGGASGGSGGGGGGSQP